LSEKTLNLAGCRCRGVYSSGSGVPVVFLHGFSFTSEIWQRTGIISVLLERKVPFLALDMPYGLKSECKQKTRNTEINVNFVQEAVQQVYGSATPVLVGASLGGHIALQFASRFPVKGLLLLAPTRVFQGELAKAYERFRFPVRIIIGSKDRIVSLHDLHDLVSKLADARLNLYEGAGHAAYLSNSARFLQDFLEFYTAAQK
jgi:pimeloyl-ACP methyl ester carboxylesterase